VEQAEIEVETVGLMPAERRELAKPRLIGPAA
jgi:hypothetical protein